MTDMKDSDRTQPNQLNHLHLHLHLHLCSHHALLLWNHYQQTLDELQQPGQKIQAGFVNV